MILFCITAVLGFLLPGYLLGRLLYSRMPGVTSFVLSLLILFQVIIWMQVCSIRIGVVSVAGALAGVSVLLGLFCRRSSTCTSPAPSDAEPVAVRRLLFGAVVVMLVIVAFRLAHAPILGADTYFRWEFLARKILEHGHSLYTGTHAGAG
jgi:hypothetical protein